MSVSEFIKILGITLLVLLVPLVCLHSFHPFSNHIWLSVSGIVVFSFLSIVIYYLGNKAVHSSNKYLYNNLIIVNFLLKFILSISVIMVYTKLVQTQDSFFLLPFVLIYIIFTIMETYFMMKQAKMTQ